MRFFGLPIIVAIVAGIIFPYQALSLLPLGFAFLFVLMLLAGLTIDWAKLPKVIKRPEPVLLGLFLSFVFFPLLQLLLARLLLTDSQFITGAIFGALMPTALVAPFFTGKMDGDEELAFLLLVASTLLVPVAAPLLLRAMTASLLPIRLAPLFKNMALLVTVPLLASYLLTRFLPGLKLKLKPWLVWGNAASLSVLIFILFGTAVGRLNLGYESTGEIVRLTGLAFFQDFGVLFLARLILPRMLPPREANSLMVCLAMKNVAISAGIMLFYDPRAALPPTLVFLAHAALFSFLPMVAQRLAIPSDETARSSLQP